MLERFQQFLAIRGLAPHGYCLLSDPALIWTHVIADGLIAAAYFSIPLVLWRLIAQRPDLKFGWMLGLFAVFILACGFTHVMGIITLWVPAYGWQALVKVLTALASIGTAILLIPLLPKLVAIPTPAELQRANAALKVEMEERSKAEAMLRQSQKMDAIGQLTGGMAHDFNNILQIVLGNLDRAQRKGADTAEGSRAIASAIAGAERAAKLTHQLLAFSRQQPLQPKPQDINEIVSGTAEMFERSLGSSMALHLDLDPDLPRGLVDRNQLENAVLNLCLNARDAMASGGIVTIATQSNGPAMIELSVTDTGSGMDPETIALAPDPFFTTKPVGKGSGLGLSQVYGTIEQLGGRVEIDSQPGTGTTVRLFLPSKER